MKYKHLLSRLSLGAAGLMLAGQSYALGTTADVTVSNAVTMNYSVNSVSQTANTSVDFEVDRRYIVRVDSSDTNWAPAVPGQSFPLATATSIHFSVTNETNDTVGIRLALVDQANAAITSYDAPTGVLAATTVTTWEDLDGDGIFNGADVVVGTGLGVLPVLPSPTFAEDETRDFYVTVDVDGGDGADLFETYTLVAAVADATGTNIVQTDDSGNTTQGGPAGTVNPNDLGAVEDVFADPAATNAEDLAYNYLLDAVGPADVVSNGQASSTSGFRTRVALGIVKQVVTLWDPISLETDPKSIPGAVMMYVIGVSADSGLNATGVLIDDDIDTALVRLGNPNGSAFTIPNPVTININGTDVDFDTTGVTAGATDIEYFVSDCAGVLTASGSFDAGPEIDDANLGTCNDTNTGYVAYFVTVNDL